MQRLRRALGKAADAKDAATARLADAKDAAAAASRAAADAATARLAGGRAPVHVPEPSELAEQTVHNAGPSIGAIQAAPTAPTYADTSPEAEKVRRAWRQFQRHAKGIDGDDQQLCGGLVAKVRMILRGNVSRILCIRFWDGSAYWSSSHSRVCMKTRMRSVCGTFSATEMR